MRALSKIFAVTVLVVVTACGGPSDTPSGPLAKHFDDMYIAAIPLDQKQEIVKTQNDWSVAKMENAQADAELAEINAQLNVVRNDQSAAKLAVDSAIANKKSAEQSADTNRINQAQKDLRAAELLHKAAEKRMKYYEAYRDYLKRRQRYTLENMYWLEAKYELAKAQLGQKNNIAPKGVSYDEYPKQEADRAKKAASARDKAESEKTRATSARENWLKQQQEADTASGKPSNFPDPMVPKGNPATTPPATAGTAP